MRRTPDEVMRYLGKPGWLERFFCWLRFGHRWTYSDYVTDERECERCGLRQYVGIESMTGKETWFSK
jgi:hypothetical protein